MSRPVEALVAAREALAPGGSVLVVDERVADAFAAPGDQVERIMYGWSVVHCLPVAMAEQPSAALGTVLREEHAAAARRRRRLRVGRGAAGRERLLPLLPARAWMMIDTSTNHLAGASAGPSARVSAGSLAV